MKPNREQALAFVVLMLVLFLLLAVMVALYIREKIWRGPLASTPLPPEENMDGVIHITRPGDYILPPGTHTILINEQFERGAGVVGLFPAGNTLAPNFTTVNAVPLIRSSRIPEIQFNGTGTHQFPTSGIPVMFFVQKHVELPPVGSSIGESPPDDIRPVEQTGQLLRLDDNWTYSPLFEQATRPGPAGRITIINLQLDNTSPALVARSNSSLGLVAARWHSPGAQILFLTGTITLEAMLVYTVDGESGQTENQAPRYGVLYAFYYNPDQQDQILQLPATVNGTVADEMVVYLGNANHYTVYVEPLPGAVLLDTEGNQLSRAPISAQSTRRFTVHPDHDDRRFPGQLVWVADEHL